ncbi:MAG: hypothetical protein GY761_00580 [Hyphomicrobiales bacterium]|nr:hypothetical protein [Hyphomicrobiales bacterium]
MSYSPSLVVFDLSLDARIKNILIVLSGISGELLSQNREAADLHLLAAIQDEDIL